MYAINPNDEYVKLLASTRHPAYIKTYKDLKDKPLTIPVIFRSMAQRKTVNLCEQQGRDYYYIDTGYLGISRYKKWHRVVKNGVQHSEINYDMPCDRFKNLASSKPYLKFSGWKKDGRSILLVTPSEKPCKFYGIQKEEWVNTTLQKLKQHTDRPIVVRNKTPRQERIKDTIYHQIQRDNVFAVVTYNSIAAVEAIGYGVPAFTDTLTAADTFCLKDLTRIENPLYEDKEKIEKWQHWLAYCQYTVDEMRDGTVFNLIKEYNLQ